MTAKGHTDRYLKKRGRVYWYRRRVPNAYAGLDTRIWVEESLRTQSLETARLRRDLKAEADEAFWRALLLNVVDPNGQAEGVRAATTARYEAARARALEAGFVYRPAEQLAEQESAAALLERLLAAHVTRPDGQDGMVPRKAEAVLGGAKEPVVRVSDAFKVYVDEIGVPDLLYKSDHQRYTWRKVKRTSVQYFIDQLGDMPIRDITRDDALSYHRWWLARMVPGGNGKNKPFTANTVNRHIGNMRTMYERYFKHVGEDDRPNPFRGLYIKQKTETEVPPYSNRWVRTNVLAPGALKGLRPDLQLITLMLIETGCRPSEIINLQPGDIHLDGEVPYISIRARASGATRREVKTDTSERDIPLVGVSLEAARRSPAAFPHYYDRNELVSANLMKAFRNRGLLESDAHRMYSFRHSFEKRMQEANIDYQLRCALMGHKNTRPKYGDGGELAYRRAELMKIVHPFDEGLFGQFDQAHDGWWRSGAGTP